MVTHRDEATFGILSTIPNFLSASADKANKAEAVEIFISRYNK